MSTVAIRPQPSSDQRPQECIVKLIEECSNSFIEFYTEYALITLGPQVSLDDIDAPLLWRFVEWGSKYGLDAPERSLVLNHISKSHEIADLTECTLKCLRDALALAKSHVHKDDISADELASKVGADSARIKDLVECLFEIFRHCYIALETQSKLKPTPIRPGRFTEIF